MHACLARKVLMLHLERKVLRYVNSELFMWYLSRVVRTNYTYELANVTYSAKR